MCCSYQNRMLYPIMTDIVKAIRDLCEQFKSLCKKTKKKSYSHLRSQSHNRPYHSRSRVILNSLQSRARLIHPQSRAKVSHLWSKSYSWSTASFKPSLSFKVVHLHHALRVEKRMFLTLLDPGMETIWHRNIGATCIPGVEQDNPILVEHVVKWGEQEFTTQLGGHTQLSGLQWTHKFW